MSHEPTAVGDGDGALPRRQTPWWRSRWTRRALTVLVVGAVAALFARELVRNADEVRRQDLQADWRWAAAVLLFAAAVPVTGLLWRAMLRSIQPDARVSVREAVALQCASWLLKYIPGQVGSTLNKILWAGRKGVSRAVVVITVLYENVFLQVASLAPGAAIVAATLGPQVFGDEPVVLLLPVLALAPLLLLLWRPAFHRIVAVPARRALKRDVPREFFLRTRTTVALLAGFLVPRLLNAAGFVLLAVSVSDVAPADWPLFGAAYVLAGAIGILAILVPSGLGVREAVIVVLIAPTVGVAAAIVISVLARLCATVGDAVVALVYVLTRRTVPKEHRP